MRTRGGVDSGDIEKCSVEGESFDNSWGGNDDAGCGCCGSEPKSSMHDVREGQHHSPSDHTTQTHVKKYIM